MKKTATINGVATPAHFVTLNDGIQRRLAWNMNAKIALKQRSGINVFSAKEYAEFIRSVAQVESDKDKHVRDVMIDGEKLRLLLWALLLDHDTDGWEHDPSLSPEKVGALMPADADPVLTEVIETLNDAQPEKSSRPFAGDAADTKV